MKRYNFKFSGYALSAFCALTLAACAGVKPEASYPTRPEAGGNGEIVYSNQEKSTIFGKGETLGSQFFGGKDSEDTAGSTGIGVNSFLWRAALDTVSFMPVQSADPFGGVILTDWYENPETPGERFKMNILILDRQLRSDGIRVSVFKQVAQGGTWRDAAVPKDMALQVEDAILTRARELRVQQAAAQ